MERSRLKGTKVEDRITLVKILCENGYTVRIVQGRSPEGKKQTYIEYWEEEA